MSRERRQDEHEPRLLHARSEHGYTHTAAQALPGEPEAVSETYQAHLTRQAAHRGAERDLEALRAAAFALAEALNVLAALPLDARMTSHVRAMRRQLQQLDRRIRPVD